jgi:hypothetical protein
VGWPPQVISDCIFGLHSTNITNPKKVFLWTKENKTMAGNQKKNQLVKEMEQVIDNRKMFVPLLLVHLLL